MPRHPEMPAPGTRVAVSVPGSTSNIGPGFDCLGCALAIRNRFEFEVLPSGAKDVVELSGPRSVGIPTSPDNLALVSARKLFEMVGIKAPPMKLTATIEIPGARGQGSSSTAVVGGILGADALLGEPYTRTEILDIAVAMEGHPDNVAPAILGGLVASAPHSHPLASIRTEVHRHVRFIFLVPDYEVSTAAARALLPKQVPHEDAVFNAARVPLVWHALQSGDLTNLRDAIEDRLHQPYRKPLFRGYDRLAKAAMDAGAAGFCVSGAGPSLLAIAQPTAVKGVIEALEETLKEFDFAGVVSEIAPDNTGAYVE